MWAGNRTRSSCNGLILAANTNSASMVQIADDTTIPFRWTSEQHFTIGGQVGRVVTRPLRINVAAFDVELYLGDRLIPPTIDER